MERENQPGTVEHFMKWQQELSLNIWQDAKKEHNPEMAEYAKDRLKGRENEYKAYKAVFYSQRSEKWTDRKETADFIKDAFIGLLDVLLDVEEE